MTGGDGDTAELLYAANKDRLVQLEIRAKKAEIASLRVGFLLKLLFGLFWAAIILALCAMAWRAHSSRGIVIGSFQVAPALAREGIAEEVVASQLRARLATMRLQTGSSRAVDALREDWLDDYRVEIPNTQIKVSDLNDAFRRWLGRETRITGFVVRDGARLSLTFRIGSSTTSISADNFDQLIEGAAQGIYAQTAPYLFAIYLTRFEERRAESTNLLAGLAQGGSGSRDRAWALNGLANNLIDYEGRCADALLILANARQLEPGLPNIYGNLRSAHACLGHDQAAAEATAREMQLLANGSDLLNPNDVPGLLDEDEDNLAGNYGAYSTRLALYDRVEAAGQKDQSLARAEAMARLGDVRGSLGILRRWHATQRSAGPSRAFEQAAYWNARMAQAWQLEDWPEAARFLRQIDFVNGRRGPYYVAHVRVQAHPLEAIALARSGEARRAEALLRDLPDDCYLCARARAAVAEAGAHRADADRWFRRAVRLGPRLPFAYAEWAETWLRRGDAGAALPLFDQALIYGPDYADAHKGRGDALRALRRDREAALSYANAAARAPRWGALHLAWARALWRLGARDEARARLRIAAGLDLGRADRQRLTRLIAAAGRPPS